MSTITINGITYTGNSVVVNNGRVIIDGKEAAIGDSAKTITISIQGDVQSLSVDTCTSCQVNCNAGSVKTVSGDVNCQNVQGGVSTVSGDVMCDDITGSVSTVSGDVKCKSHK